MLAGPAKKFAPGWSLPGKLLSYIEYTTSKIGGYYQQAEQTGKEGLTAVAAQPEEAHQGADVRVHQPEGLHCQPLHSAMPVLISLCFLCTYLAAGSIAGIQY
jgi:hypothetical protein